MAVHAQQDHIFATSSFEKAESILTKERARDGRNFIYTPSSELLAEINKHYLESTEKYREGFGIGRERELAPFILASISQRWRSVVLEDASMFGSFVLGPEDGKLKVQTMLEKGSFREIQVGTGSGVATPKQVSWLKGCVGEAKKLDIHLNSKTTFRSSGSFGLRRSSPSPTFKYATTNTATNTRTTISTVTREPSFASLLPVSTSLLSPISPSPADTSRPKHPSTLSSNEPRTFKPSILRL